MKKMITFAITIFLVLSGLGAVALNIENKNDIDKTNNGFLEIDFSSINVVESNEEFISFTFSDEELYLLNPGKPMIPKTLKKFELPFGVTNIEVEVIPIDIQEMDISKEIQPVPSPMPLTPVDGFIPISGKDESIYGSSELFPKSWFSYNVGCGLNKKGDHVTHLVINFYPVRYSPLLNKLSIANTADIRVSYDESKVDIFPTTSEYDLVIITPSEFQSNIQPLIEHKNSYGVNTILKTTEEIYDEYDGVDKPEQIKYFIKDALETWNMKYVLLLGGLKSTIYAKPKDDENKGEKGWYIPVRYSNMRVNGDQGYPTDLYYADIYKYGGEFETWDYDGDGIFAEWTDDYPESRDISDLLPDVAVGRLACSSPKEVSDVANKIITYETTSYGEDWFKKITAFSGDGFLDQFDLDIQWDTNEVSDGDYIIKAQSYNPEGEFGSIDEIQVTVDKSVESVITFNHDDHLNPSLENGYPAPPIAEIVSVSNGNIIGNTDVNYEPSGGEAYCNDLFWWGNVSYVDGVLTIRGKSYDPKPYGNLTNIKVWIENNQGEIIFEDWRYDMPTYYEGEWATGEREVNGRGGGLYYMPEDFEKEIIWTSNGKFTGPESVKEAFDKGSGFAFFSGHGSPGTWEDQTPGIPGNRQHASVTGLEVSNLYPFYPYIRDLPIFPMENLENTNKLPITVVGGCHNSLFNVSFVSSVMHIFWYMYLGINTGMWTYGQPVPQCWSWYLVQLPDTGAIATIGNTGLGWGWEGEFCTVGAGDGWITSEFFRQYGDHYGEDGFDILGNVYQQTQTSYINQFKDYTLPECWWYPDFGWDGIDQQAVEQWVLLGDPSLKIGGYP